MIIRFGYFLSIAFLSLQCVNKKANSLEQASPPESSLIQAFNAIDTAARLIIYTNPLEVNHEGGHIQGVQWMSKASQDYAVLSASSSTYAYYGVIRLGNDNEVISVNKILDKPFKHAGGFQIHDDYMAVGIEDNEARNISKVYIYDINNPEQAPQKPIAVIERNGAYERATAGCVGMCILDQNMLIVVGDWNTRHLDFYLSDSLPSSINAQNFKQVATMSMEKTDRKEWIDQKWLPYQNINLIRGQENKLYLTGLARNEEEQDVADLYEVKTTDLENFELIKVATKQFQQKGGTNFQWGAGVHYDVEKNKMQIISTTDHLDEQAVLNLFQ